MGTVVYVPSFGNNLVPQTREKSETKTVLETYQEEVRKLLNVADMAINRTYLMECEHFEVQQSPVRETESNDTSCTKLFRLKRFVYNPEESVIEKLKTFYLSLLHLPLNRSVFMVIRNEKANLRAGRKAEFSVYLGIRSEKAEGSVNIEEILENSFNGTFLGSELESVTIEKLSLPEAPRLCRQ